MVFYRCILLIMGYNTHIFRLSIHIYIYMLSIPFDTQFLKFRASFFDGFSMRETWFVKGFRQHSCLTYIMKGKWSSFSQLGGMFPSKMIILIITCWFKSPYFLVQFMVPHFLHEVTMENPLVFSPYGHFAAQLRVICSGPVLLDLHRSRVCIRSQGSWFATSWSTTCVCPRPSDFLGKSGQKSEAMSKNGGIWRYT